MSSIAGNDDGAENNADFHGVVPNARAFTERDGGSGG